MARYSAGALTGAGSTLLPLISLYSGASVAPVIREISVSNTTSTAVALKLIRLTSQGTPGAGLTEAAHDPNSVSASSTAFNTHSANPSLGADLGYRAQLGAAVGAGWVWVFGGDGLRLPVGTANGVGVIVENGSGQPIQATIVFDE
jgi:hypothetical protein